ncbi:hypothetical protein ACFVGN_29140 [Streptomyces sp. NPDC057757]|uniref:hypothetical protein n=1 Tax=Streptomyces sp. NPDC057757 TaxID=3346241 RepID=UPI0036C57FAD
MSEWQVAMIAAGSALAGGAVTGWFTRSAGLRQAEAAKHAGDRQADALLHTVQDTMVEQRRARVEDRRRQVYVEFLMAAQDLALDRENAELNRHLQKSLAQVHIEGPAPVTVAALAYASRLDGWRRGTMDPEGVAEIHTVYINAVRTALGIEILPGPEPDRSAFVR